MDEYLSFLEMQKNLKEVGFITRYPQSEIINERDGYYYSDSRYTLFCDIQHENFKKITDFIEDVNHQLKIYDKVNSELSKKIHGKLHELGLENRELKIKNKELEEEIQKYKNKKWYQLWK